MAWLLEIEKAYLAGIIDGEGSIGIYKWKNPRARKNPFYRARMRITNTNKKLIDLIVNKLQNQKGYIVAKRENRIKNRKTCYELELGEILTKKLLKEVLPYLVIKKKHAENVLKLKENYSHNRLTQTELQRREKIYLEQKKLYYRGLCLG